MTDNNLESDLMKITMKCEYSNGDTVELSNNYPETVTHVRLRTQFANLLGAMGYQLDEDSIDFLINYE